MDIKQFVRSLAAENGTFNPFEIAENKGIVIQMEPLGTIRGYYSKALEQNSSISTVIWMNISKNLPVPMSWVTLYCTRIYQPRF